MPNVPEYFRSRLNKVAFVLSVLVMLAGLAIDAAGQAPSPPTNVQVLSDTPTTPFAGTTVYVSTSGSDTSAGTATAPVRTIQQGVKLANAIVATNVDARVLVAAGTYREAVSVGTTSGAGALTIEGIDTATTILSGADDISTGWTLVGNGVQSHAWANNWGLKVVPDGWSGFWTGLTSLDKDALLRSEVLYFNNTPLIAVTSQARLAAGRYFVDEAGDKIYLYPPATMSGAAIEVGVRQVLLAIASRNKVTVKNLTIQRNRAAVQDAMIDVRNANAITFDGLTIKQAGYTGLSVFQSTGMTVAASTLSDNGVNAFIGYKATGVLVADTTIARNNWRGSYYGQVGWDSVFKWAGMRDSTVRRSSFIDNIGNGWWLDTDNTRVTLEDSLLSGQTLKGISLENNQGPIIIRGNRICNNTQAGIGDAQSDKVAVLDNQVFNNRDWNVVFSGTYAGQTMTAYDTGVKYTNKTLGWTVTGNTFVGSGTGTGTTSGGWLFWHTDYLVPGAWAASRDSLVAFDRNTWVHTQKIAPFTMPGGAKTYAQFKADLQIANAGFETNSSFVSTAPALTCTLP